MKASGLMSMEFEHGNYYAVLRGSSITAWKDEEAEAFYIGEIEGLEAVDPVLFNALIEKGAIKKV